MLRPLPPIPQARIRRGRARLAATTREQALVELQEEYLALCDRRARRLPTGRRHTLRCGHCYRFVASLSQPCTACGWDPATGWGQ